MSAPKVFLSYSPRDAQAVAAKLYSSLSKRFEVWQDIHRIQKGWQWDEEIEAGLRSSQVIVFLLTPQSVREKGSPGNKDNTDSVCRDELSFARDHGMPVVPVRALPCDTPLLIHRLQQVDFQRWQQSDANYDAGFQRICETVDAALRGEKRERAWGRLPAPWDFEPFLQEKLRDFTGREWLFAEIEEWLHKGSEKALLITGDPGVGKSSVAAALIRNNPDGQVLAYHCCRADTKATTDPAVFVRSLAAMLAARLGSYEAMLEAPEISRVLDRADEDPASTFDAAILGPLTKLPVPETGPRYLLIDGLDEACGRRPTIVEVLSNRLSRLPQWLRIVATTRRDPEVLARLKDLEARELGTQDPRNLDDVRKFVVGALRGPGLHPRVESNGKPAGEIAETLLKSSGGNFLIVTTTLDAIRRGQLTLAEAEGLPAELDVRYRTFFDRLFVEANVDFKSTREVLEIILAALEPLGRSELAAVTGLDLDYDLGPLLDRLAAFLPVRDGRHVLFHESLAGWLSGKDAEAGQPKAGPYYVNPEKGRTRLADWCWSQYERGPHKTSLYYLRHLPAHLAETRRTDQLKNLLLTFNWLQAKLSVIDVVALIADFDYVAEDWELARVKSALLNSANALRYDINQLAAQLLSRLGEENARGIKRLLASARGWRGATWLRPIHSNLHPAGTALLRTLWGHSQGVHSVQLSMDGRRAISGAEDTCIAVWDLMSGLVRNEIKGHSGTVLGLSQSLDGRSVLSGSWDKTLKLWDVETGRELLTLRGHTEPVLGVALSADGRLAISASGDKTLKVWDAESGQELRTLYGHTERVQRVALSADGRLAVSASGDTTLKVWDVESGKELRTLHGHTMAVLGVALSADGRLAVSGSWDKTVKVWDVERGRESRTLSGHTLPVLGVILSADGRLAISGSADKTIRVWDLEGWRELRALRGHADAVTSVACSMDGQLAVSGSLDCTLKVWDMATREEAGTPQGHADPINSVAVSADGKLAVSGSHDKTLKVWDVESGRALRTLCGHATAVTSVAVSADGKLAVSGSYDKTLKVWDVESGRALHTFSGHAAAVTSVAVSADGKLAVSGSYDCCVKVWDVQNGRELGTLIAHDNPVSTIALSADGALVMSGSGDFALALWDVRNRRGLRPSPDCHVYGVSALALNADGRRAISGARDGTFILWDVESGRRLFSSGAHHTRVTTLALSGNGRLGASGGQDQILRVWDLEQRQPIASFMGESSINACAFSSDGRTIAAGESSGRIHFLRLVLEDEPTEPEKKPRRGRPHKT